MKQFNREYHELTNPTEAVKITHRYHPFFIADATTCRQIVDAYNAEIPAEDRLADPIFYRVGLYVALYNAGRIQGKREERARRRTRGNQGEGASL